MREWRSCNEEEEEAAEPDGEAVEAAATRMTAQRGATPEETRSVQ